MTKDLGTYHLRVNLMDGSGWIEAWNTGWRYMYGTESITRLDAPPIPPTFENEDDLFNTMVFAHTEGNASCDCNKALSLARAYQKEEPDMPCGNRMKLIKLTAIRPDRSEEIIFEERPDGKVSVPKE